MCHENLLMEFNDKINLLVGNNGSGKSAIITALAIGLGADARVTNRGKSNKGEFFVIFQKKINQRIFHIFQV